MKIENITISNVNLDNNSAKLTFNITECTKNVNVHLKINENEYISIYTNKSNSTLSYNLTNLRRGINSLFLKLISSNEEYITDVIVVKVKENGSIKDLNCVYTDSTGKYILEFLLSGDTYLKYSIDINIDNTGYKQIYDAQIVGSKSYEGTGLSLGSHKCKLKINDGYDTYETSEYSFNVTNHKPLLSDLVVIDIKNNGSCSICYGVNDVETSTLSHSLTIDNNKKTISPTKVNDFYSYVITGLSVGKHTLMIGVTDGKDTVNTNTITIEIFQGSTNNKRLLEIAKTRYDFSYQQLKRVIETTISDGIFNYDTENEIIIKSQNYYKEMYSEFNRISITSIDVIGNKKIANVKADLNNEINDVFNAIDTLENTMETTFKDGVLSDGEKKSLRNTLNLVAKEKADIDKDYTNLYNNADLTGNAKTNLKGMYDTFVNKHNTLTTTVNNIMNKVGIVDNTDKSNLDTAFVNWRTALGNYRDASMNAIDSIARKKVDDSADVTNKYWSEIILGDNGIQSRVGSLETKITGTGGIDERLRSTEQKITTEGITNLIKDEFYTKEVTDTRIEGKVNEVIGDRIEGAIGETLDEIINENLEDLQEQIDKNKMEIETSKKSIAEHTTALNNITSRVSTTESNITKINGNVTSVTERVSTAEQKITETAITNTVSKSFYTKGQTDDKVNSIEIGVRNLLKNSKVNIVDNSNYLICTLYFGDEKPVEGETYTITLKGSLASTKKYFTIYNSGASVQVVSLVSVGNNLYTATTSWKRGSSANTHINIYAVYDSQTGASSIEWVKMVKGNKPTTDWTPAPEDAEEKIETLNSTVTQTNNSFSAKITQNEKDIASLKLTNSEFDVTIKNKADSNNIISKINASTESIKISSSKINISGLVTFSDLSASGKTTINGSNITSGTIRGIKIISSTSDSVSRGELTGSGLNFYSPSKLAGTIFFDSNGEGTAQSAKDRFLIQSKNGYVLKLLSSGDISIQSADEMFLQATKIRTENPVNITNTLTTVDITNSNNISTVSLQSSTGVSTKILEVSTSSTLSGNTTCSYLVCNKTVDIKSTLTCASNITATGSISSSTDVTAHGGYIKLANEYLYAPDGIGSSYRYYLRLGNYAIQADNSYGFLFTSSSGSWMPIRGREVYTNSVQLTSDERLKTDIKYVNKDEQSINPIGLVSPNVNITTSDMHEFVETLPMVSYRMIDELDKNVDNTHYGFLAQEILYTKVGSELVQIQKDEYGNEIKGGYLSYSQDKYISFICGALQEEIKRRKELEEKVLLLEQKINKEE